MNTPIIAKTCKTNNQSLNMRLFRIDTFVNQLDTFRFGIGDPKEPGETQDWRDQQGLQETG